MILKCSDCIFRTARVEPTTWGAHWADEVAITFNQRDGDGFHHLPAVYPVVSDFLSMDQHCLYR